MDECIWESRCCLIDLLFLSHCLFSEIKAKDHLLKIGAPPVAIEISNASLWDWERLHRISKVRKTFWHQKNEPFWYIEKVGVYGLWWRHILLHFPGPIVRGKKQNKMNLFIIIDIFPLWYIHGKSVNLLLVNS